MRPKNRTKPEKENRPEKISFRRSKKRQRTPPPTQ